MYDSGKKERAAGRAHILLTMAAVLACAAVFGFSCILLGTVCVPGVDAADISAGAAGLAGIFAYLLTALWLMRRRQPDLPESMTRDKDLP